MRNEELGIRNFHPAALRGRLKKVGCLTEIRNPKYEIRNSENL